MGSRAKPALQVQGTLRPAWRQLEQLFASRDDLVDCLAGVQDPRIDQLLRLLADPQNAKTSLALLARHQPLGLLEQVDPAMHVGVETRQEYVRDVARLQARPLAQPRGQGRRGQPGIDHDGRVPRADQRGRGVPGAHGGAFPAQRVGGQGTD